MAAVADQQVGAGPDAGVQVEALHAAAAALALAVLVYCHHDDRTAGALHQPGRHDADDAGVPVPAPEQDHPVFQPLGLLFQQFLRRLEDLQFRLLPPDVDVIQFMRQFLRPFRILAQHQLQRRHGTVHAACGIDAGCDGITDVLGGHRLFGQPHFFQQSFQAGAVGVLQLPQTGLDQGAVLAGQRHHIRHGAHGGQIAAVVQHLFRRAAVQRGTQLERHAGAAQPLEGTGVVLPAGIHDRHGPGQGLRRQMVIGDDEVHAQFRRKFGFLHGGDAVVHSHDELIAFVVDGLDGVTGQAVAVTLAAGQHTFDGGSHALEMLIQQCRGGHAVHVIVPEDHDGLAVVDGLPDALAGFLHIGQQAGITQLFLPGQQGQGVGGVGDAPGGQDARQQRILLLLGRQCGGIFLLTPGFPVGSIVFQFLGGLFGNGMGQFPQDRTVQCFQFPGTVGHVKSLPVRPSLASIPCSAAISLETSSATSESRVSYRLLYAWFRVCRMPAISRRMFSALAPCCPCTSL